MIDSVIFNVQISHSKKFWLWQLLNKVCVVLFQHRYFTTVVVELVLSESPVGLTEDRGQALPPGLLITVIPTETLEFASKKFIEILG